MKRLWHIVPFLLAGLAYFAIKYLILGNRKQDNRLLQYLDSVTIKSKAKINNINKNIEELNEKKASPIDFDGYSRQQLIDTIKNRLKSRTKRK